MADYITLDESNKFWSKVEVTDECWLWHGQIDNYGYGVFYCMGRNWMAHRLIYEEFYEPIPLGLEIDHLCRVRNCVNPEHLEAVTSKENHRRRVAVITHCPNGHEYTDDNTYLSPNNGRQCRICMKNRQRVYQTKRRQKLRELREERRALGLRFDIDLDKWV